MRIISGDLKGKKILLPKDKLTRPLKDLTKESIFNIIKHSKLLDIHLDKSNVLDLFSGVGSFGLECLSRGALFVTFLESYKEALTVLRKNIANMSQQSFTRIIEKDIFAENTLKLLNNKFDIIFIDAPYKEKKVLDLSFEGEGCAISLASASILTETLKGKDLSFTKKVTEDFLNMVKNKTKITLNSLTEDQITTITSLSGVQEFPMRVKCATMVWHTFISAVDKNVQKL